MQRLARGADTTLQITPGSDSRAHQRRAEPSPLWLRGCPSCFATAGGCEKIFQEQVSSMAETRPALVAALDWVREGDELVATKIDRLARSVADLLRIVEAVRAEGATLYIGNLGRINGDPMGSLLLNVLGAIAQFEREMMLERQREGIAKAQAEGKYKGRAPTARAKAAEVLRLACEGVSKAEIARTLGIGEASVYRVIRSEREKT